MRRFFLLLAVLALGACGQRNPVLSITGGQIQGVPGENKEVLVYKGIPYAAPPVGELRWKAPQPVVPWEGVKVADTYGLRAMQRGNVPGSFYWKEFYWEGDPEMSEDCLYLNVFTPAKAAGRPEAKLPVAMNIHGGAFSGGYPYSTQFDGEAWAERGVILVTVAYRLGILGFLNHPELSAEAGGHSGNYGIEDQAAALKWIHDNISQFGGDPDNVTIMGQSAGGMSVKYLLNSPKAAGLFSKAIIQSGGGLDLAPGEPAAHTSQEELDERSKKAFDAAGLDDLAKMRAASYQELSKIRSFYTPHVDGPVIARDFSEATYSNTLADVPIMIGYNSQDMAALAGKSVDRFCAVRDSLSATPVFEYEFTRNLPGDDDDPEKDPGAFHSAELWFVFHTLERSWRPWTPGDYVLADEVVDAWTRFCKTGNPGWDEYHWDKPYKKIFDVKP